jgi:hypothetical protein
MATKTNLKSSVSADALVRFSIGAAEVAAADAWREAGDAEVMSAVAVHNLLFVQHGVTIAALLPRKADDAKRTNEEAAAYDFARRFHAVRRCGAECAAMLFDANVKGDTVVERAGMRRDGTAYKPQAKRALIQSIFNTDDWGAFVKRMAAIDADVERAALVAAGEMTEAEAEAGAKRGTGTTKSDREKVQNRMADVIKLLRKDVEKQDGSIAPDVAEKMAAAFSDVLKSYGM